MDINAEELDGQVTGEVRFTDPQPSQIVLALECADPDAPDGVVILGGKVTGRSRRDDPSSWMGDLLALIIREGDPDSVALLRQRQ